MIGLKNDKWIREMAKKGMITPFASQQVQEGVVSYGVTSYGYDMCVSNEWGVFKDGTKGSSKVIDPKAFDPTLVSYFKADTLILPAHGFALARSVEYFKIPRNVLCVCLGKSTYARCGLIVNVTPFEPEWEGHVTIELSNTTNFPIKVYGNEGIAQVLFLDGGDCERSYADKVGKYQRQTGITYAKVRGANNVQIDDGA